MKPQDVKAKLISQPFQVFTIHVTDGRSFRIVHPDQVMVFFHKLTVGLQRNSQGIMENGSEDIAIQRITSLEVEDMKPMDRQI